jgi:hypothetical protein
VSGDDGGVRLVELGGGRRRWVLLAAGLVVAWIAAASLVGGRGDDDATTSTTSGTTPTTGAPAEVIEGAPLLGAATGLHLVAPSGDGTARVVDLDSGAVTTVALDGTPVAVRGDGVLTRSAGGVAVLWRGFPFDDVTVVLLQTGGAASDDAFPVAGADLLWLTSGAGRRGPAVASLFSLVDGELEAQVELPAGGVAVGAVGSSLLVADRDGGVLIAPDGSTTPLGCGETPPPLGAEVSLRSSGTLSCETVAVDPATGDLSVVPGTRTRSWRPVGAAHPDGRLLVSMQADPGARDELVLLGAEGAAPVLSAELAAMTTPAFASTAWTPDGSLLLVAFAGRLHVVDPFAEGGPVEVRSFPFAVATFLPMAVVSSGSSSAG